MIIRRLHVSVTDADVRVTTADRLRKTAVRPWAQVSDLPDAISAAIAEANGGRRFPRPSAMVGVGPFAVQVKRLPATGSVRSSLDELRRHVRRHFLVGAREPFVSGRLLSDGAMKVAAFDRTIVQTVVDGCRRADVRFCGVVPESADVVDRGLMLTPGQIGRPATVPALRIGFATLAFITALAFALAAPGLAAHRLDSANQRELARLRPAIQSMKDDRASIDDVNRLLSGVERFSRRRRSMTLALAALTDAIPRESSVSDVRLDTLGGTFVVVGPRVAGTVDSMIDASLFDRLALSGAITPQPGDNGPRERATVRFQWRASR